MFDARSPPRATLRDALSVAITVGAYGVAFGAAGVAAGFSVLQTLPVLAAHLHRREPVRRRGRGRGRRGPRQRHRRGGDARHPQRPLRDPDGPARAVKGLARVAAAHVTIDESTGVALSQAPRGVDAMRAGFWLTGGGRLPLLEHLHARSGPSAPRRWGTRRRGDSTPRSPRPSSDCSGRASRTTSCASSPWRRWASRLLMTPLVARRASTIIATVVVAVVVGWRPR